MAQVIETTKTFEDWQNEIGNKKSGFFAMVDGKRIGMYTKRTGNKERTIQVKWYEANPDWSIEKHNEAALMWRNGYDVRFPHPTTEKTQLFPFTENGLELAKRFAATASN